MEADALLTVGKLLAVLLLVFANGFFVAAEFSLVGMRRSRVEEMVAAGSSTAKVLQTATSTLDASLASTQLGITLSSLALGWIGEPALAHLIEPALAGLPGAAAASHAIGIAIAFSIITTLHIVLGELAPKSLALQRTEKTALAIVRPLALFSALFRPAIFVLNSLGRGVLRLFGLNTDVGEDSLHSTEELKLLVQASRDGGLIEGAQQEVVERAFNMAEVRVRAIMTPRRKVFWIDADSTLDRQLAAIRDNKHEMTLVCRGKLDDVLGVVRKQDLLDAHLSGAELKPLDQIKEPIVVPDGASVLQVLELFKDRPVQMAIVVDEFAVVQGVVTQTDMLEAVAGDIPDAHDELDIVEREDGSLLIDGIVPMLTLLERLRLSRTLLDGSFHTVAGLCLEQLGRVPEAGEAFTWSGWRFEVVDRDGMRIDKVLATELPEAVADPS